MPLCNQAETTSVYSVSVDSRSRAPHEPDYKYVVDLQRVINRVKTVQLGSIQFQDCREAYDGMASFAYSEPMVINANCYLTIEETTTVVDKTSGAQTISTHQVNLLIPPTLNVIDGYTVNAGNQDTVATETPHGLQFVRNYYPLVNLRAYVAGAHYPRSLQTVPMPDPFPTSTSFAPVLETSTVTANGDNTFTYAGGYLDALNTTGADNDLRHFDPGTYAAYVVCDRPLPVELFTMANAALSDRIGLPDLTGTVSDATFATPIVVTTAIDHGLSTRDQVTISGVSGNTAANGTFLVTVTSPTAFELDDSVGNAAYAGGGAFVSIQGLRVAVAFGFDDVNNRVFARGAPVVHETATSKTTVEASLLAPTNGVTSFAAKIGYANGARLASMPTTQLPPSVRREIAFRKGTYSAAEVASHTSSRMNPLSFFQADSASEQRTLQLALAGVPYSLLILRGNYSATQMTTYLNTFLNDAPMRVSVDYNASEGTFTFTQTDGDTFSLLFSGAANVATAEAFGFANVDYTGQSVYTSPLRAVHGVSADATFPQSRFELGADDATRRYTISTVSAPAYASTGGTAVAPGLLWPDGTTTNDGPIARWRAGDVLCATQPRFSGEVTGATNTAPVEITSAAAHGLTTGDRVVVTGVGGNSTANGNWQVTVTGATTFELDGSAGNGAYTAGGRFYSTSVAGVDSNTYTVVVSEEMATTAAALGSFPTDLQPVVALHPTPSNSSAVDVGTSDEALQDPTSTQLWIVTWCGRSAFQLYFSAPGAMAPNLGFPSGSWPPSPQALQSTGTPLYTAYSASLNRVPTSNTYRSEACWTLEPPCYILMLLRLPCGSQDQHTHTFQEKNAPIFAKLYICNGCACTSGTSTETPAHTYLHISEEMLYYSFSGYEQMSRLTVEFQNPDGSAVDFNGAPHTFSLLFTMYQDQANTLCF